jgi:hypothetical protein
MMHFLLQAMQEEILELIDRREATIEQSAEAAREGVLVMQEVRSRRGTLVINY